MYKDESVNYSELRIEVSKLFFGVLTDKISVREALLKFPKNNEDKTIVASWHALCHLEADEDIRKKDSLYAVEQNEYLEFIAHTLSKGDELPENIVNSYIPYHDNSIGVSDDTFKGIIHQFKKFLY